MRFLLFMFRLIIKIVFAPLMLILILFIQVCSAAICFVGTISNFFAILCAIAGILTFFSANIINGIILFVFAFLLCPFGLPTLAIWLLAQIVILKENLQYWIYS